MSKLELVLSRLEGVRKSGAGYVAKCPAHQDRSPSLSIEDRDGRILLHCFAGCETWDVLLSMGLRFSDVMPERVGEFRSGRGPAVSAADVMRALAAESAVIAICASDIAEGKPLDALDAQRARIASGRIAEALEQIHGR